MKMHRRFLELLVVLAAIALLIWGHGITRGDSGVGFRDRWSPEVVAQVAVMQATVDLPGANGTRPLDARPTRRQEQTSGFAGSVSPGAVRP